MSTPTTFTIPSTGVYRMPDGSAAYQFTEGTVIPMSLAIALDLEGAGYDAVPVFNSAEIAAIEALAGEGGGGGGGGATFPTAEGVWYDTGTFAVGMIYPGEFSLFEADGQVYGCLVRINDSAVTGITKIGVPVACDAGGGPYTLRAAIYALDAAGLPAARIGAATTITVEGETEDTVEGTFGTPIPVAAGDLVWLIVSGGTAYQADATKIMSSFDTTLDLGSGFVGGPFGVTVDELAISARFKPCLSAVVTGAGAALPADLAGSVTADDLSASGAHILFQITHD